MTSIQKACRLFQVVAKVPVPFCPGIEGPIGDLFVDPNYTAPDVDLPIDLLGANAAEESQNNRVNGNSEEDEDKFVNAFVDGSI